MRDFSQIIVELMENKELENLKLKFQLGLQGAKCSKDSSGLRRLTPPLLSRSFHYCLVDTSRRHLHLLLAKHQGCS